MAVIYLGLGSNIAREQHIKAGLDALADALGELKLSHVYESGSVGFCGDAFYNLVVGVSSAILLPDLIKLIKRIEDENGRDRTGPKFGPRTLDIDVLTYDDLVGEHAGITLPRTEITRNAYVLLPMAELAGEVCLPGTQESYNGLWRQYDQSRQPLKRVSFNWLPAKVL
jgi:2-amino-4-hydroxy-6-hydroxymethyldihydropteridine diphosphokinase